MQVACTINYGRKPLWKKQQKLSEAKISFVSLGVLGGKKFLKSADALTIQPQSARINKVIRTPNGSVLTSGPVAQLGARFHGMEEVVGSIPTRSTILSIP